MPTLTEIQSQIKNLNGFETFLERREIKELPNILWADETLENIIQGVYNNGHGILIATNKRLVFVDKGIIYGLKVEDFPYDKITTIQYETGIIFGKLTIFTSGNKAVVDNVIKAQVRVFGDWVRARISAPVKSAIQQPTTSVENNTQDNINVVHQLERLAKLKEQGILTEDEFTSQKKKILGI